MVGGLGVWGGWGVREREKGTTVLCSVKISFHILQIKRAAAHTPLQHFKKVCQKHMAVWHYTISIFRCKHTITT